MVGHRFLVPPVGVRVPVGQPTFCFWPLGFWVTQALSSNLAFGAPDLFKAADCEQKVLRTWYTTSHSIYRLRKEEWGRAVIITFANEKLARQLTNEKTMLRTFGLDRSKALKRRIADLDAVEVLHEMLELPGHCEELRGDRAGQLSVRLTGNHRLIFEPKDQPPARKADGGLDWKNVRSVCIVEIVDYH